MFDPSTIPPIYIKPVKSGNFEIKEFPGPQFELWVKDEKWMNITPIHNETIKQMYSHYDIAYGNVLVTGLGFGIASLWIASKASVRHVTVVERSPEVIEAFLASNEKPDNMTIICQDANEFTSDQHFDCILSDHFENEGFQTIIDSMNALVKRVPNHDVVWFWPLEHIYSVFTILQCGVWSKHVCYDAFRHLFYNSDWLKTNPTPVGEIWTTFKNLYMPDIKLADPNVEYFNVYYNVLGNAKVINP